MAFNKNEGKLACSGDAGAALQFFLQFRVVVKMKENEFIPKEMSANQRRIFIDTAQLYEAYIVTFRESRS